MLSLPILVWLLAIAASLSGLYFAYRRDARRRQALESFAAAKGWAYTARDDSWAQRFTGTPFGQGDHRQARNILSGTVDGHAMVAFDYSFQTHSSDGESSNTTTHRYAVCVLALPGYLPHLELSPENLMTRVGNTILGHDIELESEDFNRRYRVRADNPKFAYDVLNPRTMQALLAKPVLNLRVAGADAFCWESGRTAPVTLLARLSALTTLLGGIPSYVWSDHNAGGAPA